MNPQLLALVAEHVPEVIQTVKLLWQRKHPNDPEPTGDEIVAAYQKALSDSLTRDEQWLASHPKP